jgi:uncharacterized protein YdeI (YjbR/CyaY-like superfamily)
VLARLIATNFSMQPAYTNPGRRRCAHIVENKAILAATQAQPEKEARVPTDLRQALAAAALAKAQWSDLTPIARRDFISWIDSAKQPETRRRRIERACSMLVAGKRRPCCYSIVSFDLYTALAARPDAKAQWSDLTPIARRNFISWMDSAKQPEAHRRRVEKACSMLAAGKRRP